MGKTLFIRGRRKAGGARGGKGGMGAGFECESPGCILGDFTQFHQMLLVAAQPVQRDKLMQRFSSFPQSDGRSR